MEKQETLKNIIHCIKVGGELASCVDCSLYPCSREDVIDLAKVGIEALEKQIPKKPDKLTYKLLLDNGWVYKCPNCGCACGENKFYSDVTKDDLYCTQCGQRLDWE